MFTKSDLIQSATYALVASVTMVALLFMGFFFAEPSISRAQAASDTATFSIEQTITDESSFLVNPSNAQMDGAINGISGGTANGSSTFSVQSNNSTGYYVEIAFFDNGTEEAMLGADSADESIRDFAATLSEPTQFFTASTAAQFGYTIQSLTDSDTDDSFLQDGGGTCGAGSTENADECWMSPTTTAFRIVDRGTSAPSGATSTLHFRVVVPNNPSPVPAAETYYATATLSLFAQ